MAKMKKKAKKRKRVKRVKGKRAVALPLTTVSAVGQTRSTTTITSGKPAKKRPVLHVEAFRQGSSLSWRWGVKKSLNGGWLFESLRPCSSEQEALRDARKVLGRLCAGCEIRWPK